MKKGKKTGKYEVVAEDAGCRAQAVGIGWTAEQGARSRLPLVGREEALELSLTENSGREGMHPADLVMAYRNLTQVRIIA